VRVAIVGSRNFGLLELVGEYVCSLPIDTVVITGGARGVDRYAENTARAREMRVEIFPADWTRYGKSAGFRRNVQMVERADKVVAFWDGKSPGTKHSIELARIAGKLDQLFMDTSRDSLGGD
jgi:CTP:molybdopterin cytidylyltransferase MocA